jgi:diaminohydroxyphosphoribosylaminopyrimidine deaminase/5-amino-6-(5-phosphoribosylamino)uracil reductase
VTADSFADERWMAEAVALAERCVPSERAYSVGAVVVSAAGEEIARGFSRELDPVAHAEEVALSRLDRDDPRLSGATLYSTLEPCSRRASRPRSCTELILERGIAQVVIAWREPSLFVADRAGVTALTRAGVVVRELPAFAARARAVNAHLAIED